MILKNENKFLKQFASDFCKKYKLCGYSNLDVILFIRRLNNIGYLIIKEEDVKRTLPTKDSSIKKYIVPWTSNNKKSLLEKIKNIKEKNNH